MLRRLIPKFNILNLPILLYLLFFIVFTIINYPELNENEGWGMVGMIGISGIMITGIIVDLVIHNTIKSTQIQFYARLISLAFYTVLFISFLRN